MENETQVTDAAATSAPVDPGAGTASATPPDPTQQTDPTQQPDAPTFDASLFEGNDPDAPADGQQPLGDLLSLSPYIQDEQTLRNAIQRQGDVEAVLNGQAPASALFEGMRQQNPQQWTQLMNGVAEYVQQVTGYQLVDPSQIQGQQQTPEQQRIAALEQQHQNWQRAQEEQRQQQVVQQAQKQLMEKIPELTKGRFIEGEDPQWVMQQLGYALQGKENQVIQAIAKGDMILVQKAIQDISKREREMFNARGKRIAQQRTALKKSLPGTNGGKGSPDMVTGDGKIDTKDPNWFGKVASRILTQ